MKTIVIGIDGMDYVMTERLIKENKLPNFKKLKTFSALKPNYPPHSPVCWTTIATGKNPGEHGIYDFIVMDPKTYTPKLSLFKQKFSTLGMKYEQSVLSKSFWEIAEERGIKTRIIRWPMTFPSKNDKTISLAGLGVPDLKGFLSGYTFYTTKDLKKEIKTTNKIVKLKQAEIIETEIFGPRKQTSEGIKELTSSIVINLKDKTIQTADSKIKFEEGKWTEWINISFSVGFMKKIHGIFKAFVKKETPFEMFITTIQIDPENPSLDISNPKDYSKKIAEEIKQKYYTLGIAEETDGLNDGIIDEKTFLAQTKEIDLEKEKIFWNEFAKFKEGIFAFVFDTSDRLQHMFWQSNKKVIEDYLIEKDKLIGEVLKKIDEKTHLIILSDHGFTEYDYSINVNKWLEKEGFLKTKSEKTKFPFENIDWTKTKAYSVGFNSIYLNIEGRERGGIVKESEKEKIVNEIKNKLENLKHENKKVINRVYAKEEMWTGNLSSAPDLVVGFNKKYRMSWKSALGEVDEKIIEKNDRAWNADHLVDPEFVKGVFFSNRKIEAPKKQEEVLKIILKD